MAPVAPTRSSHRAKALARLADPTLPRKVHRAGSAVTDAFLRSKRDKQLIRKASFRARVADKAADKRAAAAAALGRVGGAAPKRRRPSNKLVATLQSLADALPAAEPIDWQAGEHDDPSSTARKHRRPQHSLRTRPGSLKRKAALVQAEMARFGQNLAQLTAVQEAAAVGGAGAADDDGEAGMAVEGAAGQTTETTAETTTAPATTAAPPKQSTANRFALLRSYITATMDQSPAFAKAATR